MAATLAKRMTVRELAKLYGRSERSIRRWVQKLDREHGGIIKRVGEGKRSTIEVTMSALRRCDPDFIEHQEIARDEIAELRKKASDLEKQAIVLRKHIRELQEIIQKLVAQWPHMVKPGQAQG